MSELEQEAAEQRAFKLSESFGQNGMLYGCGVAFQGSFYASPDDRAARIETRTRWVFLFCLPLIPLGTYRLIRVKDVVSNRGRLARRIELVSKEPLAWEQILRVWAVSWFVAAGLALVWRWWVNS